MRESLTVMDSSKSTENNKRSFSPTEGQERANKVRKGDEEIIKGAWSPEEDETMKKAVALHGTDWKAVSTMIKGRTSKQCRDRYKLKLDPAINHGPWTPEEDEKLTELQEQLGRQWTKIAKLMPGRTENSVKSRFASLVRSRTREWTDDEDMILRSCRERNLSFVEISDRYLTKRSEHAVKKRWERLFMRDLAKKIRNEIPPNNSPSEPGQVALPPQVYSIPPFNGGNTNPDYSQQQQQQPVPPPQQGQIQPPVSGNMPSPLFSPPGIPSGGAVASALDSMLQNGEKANLSKLKRGLSDSLPILPGTSGPFGNIGSLRGSPGHATNSSQSTNNDLLVPQLVPTIKGGNHPFDFLGSDLLGQGASRVSNRSGNIKRQSTSVTILQQILKEPLKNQ
uniref:Uncharacterized protein n=1 Tax=Mucochytrium quahogii TaxID=96639 RepID=A0A7S2WK44_9STRA|mmetsp:Transcript_5271/g.8098  ORF Transcript_5271/g.8098 Transcript_5271/m.8098 type:complete len:394 (+) Transcript_5271:280-1461(+)|eukprot:CAMPEP_0203759208 /NCGR_PEP_ID=MMETSP0098-20131031/12180_1 /ASSEMBLY_ACC=CAM_ASM_000208 /TAXON_ID=96639 /ORGANISM=" , Strain NY0313808BC1" /LENGTH=393 /DNA_ID=CAMNT_0050652019 /DNA_START=3303 /DNA_END=4484 /DNA_ORIENTATION=+